LTEYLPTLKYIRSPLLEPYALKDAVAWGKFIRYIEFADDCFAARQIDEYQNGYLLRYDRAHWEDQFGSLADFRLGAKWIEHWGHPDTIAAALFEEKWVAAGNSPVLALRKNPSRKTAPWIELFESGAWRGQA
jgi:hypothetical protein